MHIFLVTRMEHAIFMWWWCYHSTLTPFFAQEISKRKKKCYNLTWSNMKCYTTSAVKTRQCHWCWWKIKDTMHHQHANLSWGNFFAMFLNCITNFIKKWQFKKNPFPFAHFVFCLMGSISIDAFFISSTALDIIILKCKYEAVIIRMPFLFSSQHKWCWKQQPQK